MKQLIQSYKTGEIRLVDVPVPSVKRGHILVKTMASLVSIGTEKHMLEIAKKSLLGKAIARPDLVRQVINKAKTEGVMEAYRQAMGRLDMPILLGYSSSGIVIDVGEGVLEFSVGDCVACTGSGYAGHTEVAVVPENLCVKIPKKTVTSYSLLVNSEDGKTEKRITNNESTNNYVSFEEAAFVALGGIALEAVRLANVSLGEYVAVIGMGLIGQIVVQILDSTGCHVMGFDVQKNRIDMALKSGAEAGSFDKDEFMSLVREVTKGNGADAVIIFAATKSNQPLDLASEISRERARIVAGGLIGLNVPRKEFYEKELELVVSRAWGPGVYDNEFLNKNFKYPYAYVRWDAKRNIEEFLNLLAKGKVRVDHLISHRFSIEDAIEAYEIITGKKKEEFLGIVLEYPDKSDSLSVNSYKLYEKKISLKTNQRITNNIERPTVSVGVVGAGLFAQGTLLPILKDIKDLRFRGISTPTGIKARHTAEKYGFDYITSDYREILCDEEIDLVFILTPHGSHARFVCEAIKAGKHVFVEKPLCINKNELKEIISTYNSQPTTNNCLLMVDFNRRFSPYTRWLKEKFSNVREPIAIHCTVNAGYVPKDSWVHDSSEGGGRIIGEVCHFVDLIQYITSAIPERVYAECIFSDKYKPSDNVVITMRMSNGAISSISYLSSGDKAYLRERIEVFGGGRVGVIENFKYAYFIRGGKKKKKWGITVDRGHKEGVEMLLKTIRNGGKFFVDFSDYVYTTLTTFAIEESIRKGKPVEIVGVSC